MAADTLDTHGIPDADAADLIRVLVVEDSPLMTAMIRATLKDQGFALAFAAHGREALDQVEHRPPHVVISDWEMPVMDGLALCRALRQDPTLDDVRFIMVTADERTDRLVEALEAGADDFVKKPFEPLELLARVRAAVRIAGLQTALRRREAEYRALATEHGVLSQVATAVAAGADPAEVFGEVARQVASLLGAEAGGVARFDGGARATLVGGWAASPSLHSEPGTVLHLDSGESVTAQVMRTGRAARIDDYNLVPGAAARAEAAERRSSIAAPIRVAGGLWGTVGAISTRSDAFPLGAEARLARFASLVALAIANAESQRQLRELATRDPLTGVANRRLFTERIESEISRARRHGHPLCLAMLDIDHFKRINDTFGHPVGDQVLTEVAALISGLARAEDVIARVGGEEFAWILPETDLDGATAAVDRLRRTVERTPFPIAGRVTISCGITALDAVDEPDSITARADEALYRAKEGGRNLCVAAEAPAAASA
ncbi:MAG: diguanylate cyclase [Actinomycetota bacterium]